MAHQLRDTDDHLIQKVANLQVSNRQSKKGNKLVVLVTYWKNSSEFVAVTVAV